MKIYAPSYYKQFKCIADRCAHSCCVGWEIDVDKKTLDKYKKIGMAIEREIAFCEEGAYIKLKDDGRCPFLTESGLCEIIIKHGEDYISDICREHPRFFNIVNGRIEAGLGMVCEEAARIILSDDSRFSLCEIGISDSSRECDTDYCDAIDIRDEIIKYVDDSCSDLCGVFTYLENKYNVSLSFHTFFEWREIFLELECLDSEWQNILTSEHADAWKYENSRFDEVYLRFMKYLVYRHVSVAENYLNLRARLGFCMLCVRLVKHLAESERDINLNRIYELVRLLSSEIEYSEDNTSSLIFEFESAL